VIGAVDQLRDIDTTRADRYWRDAVVAGRKSRASKYTGNHVTVGVVAAADATSTRITADQLQRTTAALATASAISFQVQRRSHSRSWCQV